MLVRRIHEIAEEVIYKLLRQGTSMHVGFHVDVRYQKALVLQHGLHGDDIRMHLPPRHRFHGHVNDVRPGLAYFKNGGHGETWPTMSMILDEYVRMALFNVFGQASQHARASDTRHVFQADFRCTRLHQPVGDGRIIFYGMYGRIGNAQGGLGRHARFKRIADGGDDVARLVQATENTGDVHALRMLHAIHQPTHVGRHGVHAQGVQTTVKHVRLYARLVEGLGKGAHSLVGIFAIEQVDLLEGASVGFHTGKTTHVYNGRGYPY